MFNPLLTKEFRAQSRKRQFYTTTIVYIFVISALTFGLTWSASPGETAYSINYGRNIFYAFVVALTSLICLMLPAFTVGAISSEIEKQTFDQLRITLLKPGQILSAKAAPGVLYTLILLLAATPATILIMPYGGISLTELASCYLIIFATAITFSLLGLMWSCICKHTGLAAIITYTIVGFFLVGTLLVPVILRFHVSLGPVILNIFMAMNPFHAVLSIFGRGRQFQLAGLSPWVIAVAGYFIISIISLFILLLRLKAIKD